MSTVTIFESMFYGRYWLKRFVSYYSMKAGAARGAFEEDGIAEMEAEAEFYEDQKRNASISWRKLQEVMNYAPRSSSERWHAMWDRALAYQKKMDAESEVDRILRILRETFKDYPSLANGDY